ncbi:hypothetical protein ACFX13_028731 [Malus domestica]
MGTRSQQQPGQERAGQDDDDMAGGQSVSMSGSVGSPSSRSEQTMATPAGDNSFLRLNHPDVHGDDAGSQGAVGVLGSFFSWVLGKMPSAGTALSGSRSSVFAVD